MSPSQAVVALGTTWDGDIQGLDGKVAATLTNAALHRSTRRPHTHGRPAAQPDHRMFPFRRPQSSAATDQSKRHEFLSVAALGVIALSALVLAAR